MMVLKKVKVRKTVKRTKPFVWNGIKYYIDTEGTVYHKDGTVKGTALSNSGYKIIQQCTMGGHAEEYIHRIMGYVWLGLMHNDKRVVNHKDGNKLNNKLNNLELVSQSYNVKDGINRRRMAKLANSKVRRISIPQLDNILTKYRGVIVDD